MAFGESSKGGNGVMRRGGGVDGRGCLQSRTGSGHAVCEQRVRTTSILHSSAIAALNGRAGRTAS